MTGRDGPSRRTEERSGAVDVLGVAVDPWTWPALRDEIRRRVAARVRTTVMYANIHVVNCAKRDEGLRAALDGADIVYCDGEGVRLGAHLLGAHLPSRMTGADFIHDLARVLADERAPVFWLGGPPGTADRALQILAEQTPGLVVAGSHDGFFEKVGAESDRVVAAINAARPGVVFVGMGTPVQERWVARNRARIDAPVVWCIGATAEFLTGAQRRGPPLLTGAGLEWLARLLYEPRRMFGRYVVGNPAFLARVLRARLRRAGAQRRAR